MVLCRVRGLTHGIYDMASIVETTDRAGMVRVWDLFVRVSHWVIVVGFFVAYFTEDEALTIHAWAGYTVGVFVALRIVWGFIGTRHARFSDFLFGPGKVLGYLSDLARMRGKRYLGHSPAGGAMVLLLLAGLAATVWSGLEVYAAEEGKGPLAAWRGETIASAPAVRADDHNDDEANENGDEDEHEGAESPWEEVHEVLANFVLALAILHVIGVIWSSVAHRENLVRAMFTGMKRAE